MGVMFSERADHLNRQLWPFPDPTVIALSEEIGSGVPRAEANLSKLILIER